MNNLIKELAAKANFTEQDFEDMPGLMKFAQLIMEECGNACNDIDCGRTVSSQELIAGHFGIAE